MIAQTALIQDYKTAKHTRLVSFENSNSWLKRHDDQGTLVIQAGYTETIDDVVAGNDDNPIVIVGSGKRWYGSRACQGSHTRIHGRDKVGTARESFTACLRPSDNGRDLIVIASHYNSRELQDLKPALEGHYSVYRNGSEIKCRVIQVLPVLEGLGSYEAVKPKLEPGNTLILEIGYGTVEGWLIDDSGDIYGGRPGTDLGVSKLVDSLSKDATVRSGLGLVSGKSANLSTISAGLQSETLGKLSADQWKALKRKYINSWFDEIQSHISLSYESELQNVANLVLTGGGAALLKSVKPDVVEFFTMPDRPQVASVIGAYNLQYSKVGI